MTSENVRSTAGHTRHEHLRGTPHRANLRVPDPQFPTAEGLTLTNGLSAALCIACVDGIPSDLGPQGYPVSSPVPDPPLISADAAARALQEHFLANADRGDNAANDELVAEMLRRIRALQASREGGC